MLSESDILRISNPPLPPSQKIKIYSEMKVTQIDTGTISKTKKEISQAGGIGGKRRGKRRDGRGEENGEEKEEEDGEDFLPVQRGGFSDWRKLGSH